MTETLQAPTRSVGTIAFTLRPDLLRAAIARLTLATRHPMFRAVIGAYSLGAGCLLGSILLPAALQLARHHQLLETARRALGHWPEVVAIVGSGALAILGVAAVAAEPLARRGQQGGLLLRFGPGGLCATVRGATAFFEWQEVRVSDCPVGLIFEVPTAAVHFLLPHERLRGPEGRALALLLARRDGALCSSARG